jgi:hypothetical protein
MAILQQQTTAVWVLRPEYRPWPSGKCPAFEGIMSPLRSHSPIAGHFTKPWTLVSMFALNELREFAPRNKTE